MLPSFETDRLLVRPCSMADFAACLAMDRDPEVTKHVVGPWHDPERHERFLRERIQKPFGSGLGYWSLFARPQPEQFLGWVLLIPYDGVGPDIEIGWRLNRSAWGKGYATEAARLIVEHAFRTVGLGRIAADIDPANSASMRVSEKLGLAFIGDGEHDGMPCKCYVMTREDFFAANPRKP
ncbi:GNAT family N-acetyltransferase [Bosea vaviloviae]|uniref:GNAT family N-acetyltransferase n=1 Tax=Bosea vaviloviae TaxID=1526658 RepID=A0A1D7U7K9_9HYPH|nr:GNAT family N-acetyltransferase [Bosea vaviloviae]AOO83362.1 GNAT family N-acetyltransferase [Bosea vaviloviae]